MYCLLIRPRAEKNFARFPRQLQTKISSTLKKLQDDPFAKNLDVKKLVGTSKSYRLRVGEVRIIYEVDTRAKQIYVTDIDFRRTTTYS